jgi:hypothetical protein
VEALDWGAPAKDLPGTVIEALLDREQISVAVDAQVGAPGKYWRSSLCAGGMPPFSARHRYPVLRVIPTSLHAATVPTLALKRVLDGLKHHAQPRAGQGLGGSERARSLTPSVMTLVRGCISLRPLDESRVALLGIIHVIQPKQRTAPTHREFREAQPRRAG